MKIDLNEITVRDLVKDYHDDGEGGVRGYGGKLDIRPPFQREFVYKDKQRDAVNRDHQQGLPLNVMYWAVREDGTYEVIDGQQRTISAAQYVNGDYSLDGRYFPQPARRRAGADTQLSVAGLCLRGERQREAGLVQNHQHRGRKTDRPGTAQRGLCWPVGGRRKSGISAGRGPPARAYAIGSRFVNGRAERQEYFETAIQWIKDEGQTVEEYMAAHQHDKTATALWSHFQAVVNRVEAVFPNYRKPMKGVDWGGLYGQLKDESLDPEELEAAVARLMIDDDVTKKAGIYPCLLTGEEKHLNIRAFSDSMKRKAFEIQNGICGSCTKKFEMSEMDADHITPWSEGGKTIEQNCQMLCKQCNRRKSNK